MDLQRCQHLHGEVGLAGQDCESLGPTWQTLGALWLHTKKLFSKSRRTDLSFNEICKSSIPKEWKDWMFAKLMKTNSKCPMESFSKVFTMYLSGLPSGATVTNCTIMNEMWCCQGKTGIIRLILCLYWQPSFSGTGNDWKANMQHVEDIFNTILMELEL